MTEADSIVLEHLLHIRRTLVDVRDDVRAILQGTGNLDNRYASMSNMLDRMDARIGRIERRLDLTFA